MKRRVLLICGTRPEGIKLAPVYRALRAQGSFEVRLCVTGQHRQLLDPILAFFDIKPDSDLSLMKPGQTLFDVTSGALLGLRDEFEQFKPDIVIVQGDTTTALAGALAAFYSRVKVAHVEAGLRTGDKHSPFPEEMNRVLISRLSDWHFAPTEGAAEHLRREGVVEGLHVVGNTVIDALLDARPIVETRHAEFAARFPFVRTGKRLILVTGHRRESFGAPFESMCRALARIGRAYPDVQLVYPMHLNPNVREPVQRILGSVANVHLIEPVDYAALVWLLSRAHFVLTDSGGIQEEAPSLGKPVLVMRDVTERPEGIAAGCAALVGTDEERIVTAASKLLDDDATWSQMARARNPYGDGEASRRIAEVLAS